MTKATSASTTPWVSAERRYRLAWFGVLAVAGVLYFAYNGQHRLLDPDEGRYAEIPREMLESGDFITPRLNYVKYFEKPPLLYWTVAAAMAVFGPREWAMRGVSGAASLLTVLVTIALATRMFSKGVGVLAGWVLATSLLPLVMARLLTTDALFTLCLTASWAAWWLGYDARPGRAKKTWYAAGWACLGLAVLTRGPVALVLSGGLIVVFLTARRDLVELRVLLNWPGLLVFALITVPWFYLVSVRNPEFLHFFFVVQHFQRFLGETKEHIKPFWFFIPVAVMGMGGWALLTLPALGAAIRDALVAVRGARRVSDAEPKPGPAVPSQSWAALFLLVWAIVVVGFFSASKCKLMPYILPAFPALAVLVARYVDTGGATRPCARAGAAVTAVLLSGAAIAISKLQGSQDTVPPQTLAATGAWLEIALAAAAAGFLFVTIRPRGHPWAAGMALVLAFPPMAATVPIVAKYKRVAALVTPLPPLPPQVRVAEVRDYDQSLAFYLRRRIILVQYVGELAFGQSVEPAPEFFLEDERALQRLAAQGPVLVKVEPEHWPHVRQWGILRPVAANTSNLLLGNAPFFHLTGLKPWPEDAVKQGPLLLLPRR
ncbi:MAG: phospholipid carrier-dependent glycosyltransferase [Armatimonadetes bacterium]|nr:phospholipid carrier-dependent glycosyltransferase [Armatimonadota bacterium]